MIHHTALRTDAAVSSSSCIQNLSIKQTYLQEAGQEAGFCERISLSGRRRIQQRNDYSLNDPRGHSTGEGCIRFIILCYVLNPNHSDRRCISVGHLIIMRFCFNYLTNTIASSKKLPVSSVLFVVIL